MELPSDLTQTLTKVDWERFGYFDWPDRQPVDLVDSTFSLFTRDRFLGTKEQYAQIQPALRLAWRLLNTPASSRYIYSLVWECKKLPKEFDISPGRSCYQFRRTEERDDKVLWPRLYQIWRETARYNCFGPSEKADPIFEMKKEIAAKCEDWGKIDKHNKNLVDGADLKGTGRRGLTTMITFNRELMNRISTLSEEGRDNDLEMQIVQFKLTVALCHETIHAIQKAKQWRAQLQRQYGTTKEDFLETEPYFEDECMAEVGYSWEGEVLGGHMATWLAGPPEVLVVRDWPDIFLMQSYARLPPSFRLPQRGERSSYEGRAPNKPIWYPISLRYMNRLFRQSFWSDNSGSMLDLAVKVPRTVYVHFYRTKTSSLSKRVLYKELPLSKFVSVLSRLAQGKKLFTIRESRAIYRNLPRTICEKAFADQ